jgi:hypothetical protein
VEHLDLPSASLFGLIWALFIASAIGFVVGLPLVVFRAAARRNRSSWDGARRLEVAPSAYRGARVDVPAPGRIPRVVAVASVASLGVVTVGLALGVVGALRPSHALDLQGVALAAVLAVLAVRLTRRSRAVSSAACVVSIWELAYAATLAIAGGAAAGFAVLLAANAVLVLAAAAAHRRAGRGSARGRELVLRNTST